MVLVGGAILGAVAPDALACSCANESAREKFRRADAAMVGRLVAVSTPPEEFAESEFTYEVARAYKARFGKRLTVRAYREGAMCGLPDRIGETVALFLFRDRGGWGSGLCLRTTPDELDRTDRWFRSVIRRGTDRRAGVRLRLARSLLTVRLLDAEPHRPAGARRRLRGGEVRAACVGRDRDGRRLVARTRRRWPAGREVASFRLPRNLVRSVRWCAVADGRGRLIARVQFPSRSPVRAAGSLKALCEAART